MVGDDPSSLSYINRKKKLGADIGIKVTILNLVPSITKKDLITHVKQLNSDASVDGIIIQRPVPINITKEELDVLVSPQKDVDGFHPSSKFDSPIGLAILEILKWVYSSINSQLTTHNLQPFVEWLSKKNLLVIGRGETGGGPIIKTLKRNTIAFDMANSQTKNLKDLCLKSDIIISCVGKSDIVRRDMVKKETILIGVGMHQLPGIGSHLAFGPDYNQDEIGKVVSYYTPVPGGVGPVNVVYLLKNVFEAKLSSK
jgi:methylenetetrahydrofolate dehydrogenase (NADP+)/methenyltetrahydrofolate cyclohydrolase